MRAAVACARFPTKTPPPTTHAISPNNNDSSARALQRFTAARPTAHRPQPLRRGALIATMAASVRLGTPAEVQALADAWPYLDVRTPEEFAAGHVQGAVNGASCLGFFGEGGVVLVVFAVFALAPPHSRLCETPPPQKQCR
jgi:hypothetical protein